MEVIRTAELWTKRPINFCWNRQPFTRHAALRDGCAQSPNYKFHFSESTELCGLESIEWNSKKLLYIAWKGRPARHAILRRYHADHGHCISRAPSTDHCHLCHLLWYLFSLTNRNELNLINKKILYDINENTLDTILRVCI